MMLINKDLIKKIYVSLCAKIDVFFQPIVLLALRWQIGCIFFMSGMTKWIGFMSFNPDSYDIFLYEFFCPEEKRTRSTFLM